MRLSASFNIRMRCAAQLHISSDSRSHPHWLVAKTRLPRPLLPAPNLPPLFVILCEILLPFWLNGWLKNMLLILLLSLTGNCCSRSSCCCYCCFACYGCCCCHLNADILAVVALQLWRSAAYVLTLHFICQPNQFCGFSHLSLLALDWRRLRPQLPVASCSYCVMQLLIWNSG